MKPFLIWRTDWLVGFDALDQQHLSLAALLNKLFDTLATDTVGSNPALQGLLETLAEQTRRHFQDEEACMRECGYPRLTDHHREHAMLLAELQELMREVAEGRRRFTLETLTALKYWQIDHVLNSDKAFADFVRRSQAKPAGRSALLPYYLMHWTTAKHGTGETHTGR
jgi:hemerythrin